MLLHKGNVLEGLQSRHSSTIQNLQRTVRLHVQLQRCDAGLQPACPSRFRILKHEGLSSHFNMTYAELAGERKIHTLICDTR